MPIHSLFLCNGDGLVLFKRYYAAVESSTLWENKLFTLTHKRWPHARNEIHQCISFERDMFAVFTYWGDILVMIAGDDEYDELTLSNVIDVLAEYFRENIAKRPLQELNEQQLTQSDQYDKICIGIDEIISATGILDQTDVSKINSNYKLSKPASTARPRVYAQPSDKPSTENDIDASSRLVLQYLLRNGVSPDFAGQV